MSDREITPYHRIAELERENAALREMLDLVFRIPKMTDEQLAELIQNCKSVKREGKQ